MDVAVSTKYRFMLRSQIFEHAPIAAGCSFMNHGNRKGNELSAQDLTTTVPVLRINTKLFRKDAWISEGFTSAIFIYAYSDIKQ